MTVWLEWGRGPLFVASMLVLVIGLLRLVALNTAGLVTLYLRSRRNGRRVDLGALLWDTLKALRPLQSGRKVRSFYSVVSVIFHLTILVAPLALSTHVLLWQRGLGISWPTLSNALVDGLTLVAIGAALLLLLLRVGSRQAQAISRPQDYLLLLLITTPFVFGYLAKHPSINPISYQAAMLVHVLSGDLLLLLIPFTKISHVALLPFSQLVSEFAWHLEPHAGEQVALDLGKESQAL